MKAAVRMWKDKTSYSRGAKNREPTILSLGLPYGVELLVYRQVGSRDTWFYSIKWGGMFFQQDQELRAEKVEDAKREAVKAGGELLLSWSAEMERAAEELGCMQTEAERAKA